MTIPVWKPNVIICDKENPDECMEEHNPRRGYEDHHYGCECDGCIEWYRSLK